MSTCDSRDRLLKMALDQLTHLASCDVCRCYGFDGSESCPGFGALGVERVLGAAEVLGLIEPNDTPIR